MNGYRPAGKQDQGNERASVAPLSLSLKAERLFTCFQDVQIGCLVIVDRYLAIWHDHTHEGIVPPHDVTGLLGLWEVLSKGSGTGRILSSG